MLPWNILSDPGAWDGHFYEVTAMLRMIAGDDRRARLPKDREKKFAARSSRKLAT
jgi:hypothetical protein